MPVPYSQTLEVTPACYRQQRIPCGGRRNPLSRECTCSTARRVYAPPRYDCCRQQPRYDDEDYKVIPVRLMRRVPATEARLRTTTSQRTVVKPPDCAVLQKFALDCVGFVVAGAANCISGTIESVCSITDSFCQGLNSLNPCNQRHRGGNPWELYELSNEEYEMVVCRRARRPGFLERVFGCGLSSSNRWN